MKYRQLTKEQLEALHEEFATFLASQEIDVKEWTTIKDSNPNLVEEELNLFSDMVWEDVLSKAEFITHTSNHVLNLFKCGDHKIVRIVVKLTGDRNFTNPQDFEWVMNSITHPNVELLFGSKNYSKDRNLEIFQIIESGAEITDGTVFNHVSKFVKQS